MTQPWQLNAVDIVDQITGGKLSAVETTKNLLERLKQVNPAINAVVHALPEEALAAARLVDDKIAAGDDPGILAGVPVTIKVNIDQEDLPNTNGLRIQKDHITRYDSPVVTNLRNAGAIIIGRTNTPAFSLRWFTRNSLHGHTLNPRNKALTPGGSSGGAAAAVAAGICAIGHGTDIAGSIRYPAYACGLHGIRPSFGRVPAVNLSLPDRHIGAQLTAVSGPIARSVGDLRIALKAMSAASDLDPWWVPIAENLPTMRKRVALCRNPEGLETTADIDAALTQSAAQLSEAGWEVVETDCPPLRKAMHMQLLLWMSEYHRNGGEAIKREDDPDANFVMAQLLEYCPEVSRDDLMDALQYRLELARAWQLFSNDYPVLLCPVSGELPFPDLLDVESPAAFKRVAEAQLLQIGLPFIGMPAMSVATGSVDNQPIGVQLVGARFREDMLFDAAADIEARNPAITATDPV